MTKTKEKEKATCHRCVTLPFLYFFLEYFIQLGSEQSEEVIISNPGTAIGQRRRPPLFILTLGLPLIEFWCLQS